MVSPSTRYPLPAWPREAYPFEPAHGYFRRLAAANAQVSVRTLGSYVGVNGRNFDREELLEFCSRFPSKGIENLQRSTPQIEGSLVIMNGETISRTKDYTPYHPRACVSCLRDSYYYRNWFDLSAVRFCPIHEAPLCDLNTGERMAWWQADLGHPASLSRSEDRFSYDHRSLEWACYVLGRMGVVDRCPSIVLDALPLVDVIAGCVLLGTGALANHASSSERRALPREHAAAVGFEFLKRGEEGVRDFFLAQADHAAESVGASWRGTTVDGSFGWIASAVKRSLTSEVGDICRSGLDAAIDKLGLYSRSTRLGPEPQTSSNLTLTELALRTQMPKRKVRLIADRLGLVPPGRAGSQTYWFAPSQVEAFEAFTAGFLDRNEAAERIGLLRPAFDALLAHVDLQPCIRLVGSGPSADMFVGSEVRAFVELVEHRAVVVDQPGLAFDEFCQRSNRSPGEVAFAVIQGRQNITRRGDRGFAGMQLPIADAVVVKADGPKPRRTCQHSGIGFADAASRLGISPIAVSGLVEAGHLKIQDGTIGRRQRIAPDSLDDFDAKYAAVGAYARAFNLSPQKVSADFRAAGVTILDRNGRQKVPWADRISVVSAMGDEWDLRRQLDPFSSMVWEALRSHLRSTGSPNRLVDTVSTSARIRSGSGHTLLHVSTCPTGKLVIASAQANRAVASAWLELLTRRQDDVCEMWPEALVTRASHSIRFEQIFAVGSAGTTGQLHHVARLIDQIATNLRMLRLTEKAAA